MRCFLDLVNNLLVTLQDFVSGDLPLQDPTLIQSPVPSKPSLPVYRISPGSKDHTEITRI